MEFDLSAAVESPSKKPHVGDPKHNPNKVQGGSADNLKHHHGHGHGRSSDSSSSSSSSSSDSENEAKVRGFPLLKRVPGAPSEGGVPARNSGSCLTRGTFSPLPPAPPSTPQPGAAGSQQHKSASDKVKKPKVKKEKKKKEDEKKKPSH
uniref:Immortalization up-regulated protein n=1 Tax=Sus scrofa TaxID=9823 RepID=A0A480XPD4_PIG